MSMFKATHGEQGVTLIELLLVIGLIGLVSLVSSNFLTSFWRFGDENRQQIDLQQQSRIILLYLENDIKRATELAIDDIDADGVQELLLQLGEAQYRLYDIVNNQLVRFNHDPDVPGGTQWKEQAFWNSSGKAITGQIFYQKESGEPFFAAQGDLIKINFRLISEQNDYPVEFSVHPRVAKL